ncbi:MAG: hypothetical protein ACC645_26535, partial [Pirellulales bacterium]
YASTLTIDSIPPRVIESSLQEEDTVPAGVPLVVTVRFDEELDAASPNVGNIRMTGEASGQHVPSDVRYDPARSELTIEFEPLPEDRYTLYLLGRDGALQDLVGNDLDGEPFATPIPPNRSGDGVAGGDFVVRFETDFETAPFAGPLEPTLPIGSLVYRARAEGSIGDATDTDTFTVDLVSNQTMTVRLTSDSSLQGVVTVSDPAGQPIDTATASAPGERVLLQTMAATAAGTYTIAVSGAGGSTGIYSAELVLGAAIEEEGYGDATNGERISAQDLSRTFVTRGTTGAERGAVLGTLVPMDLTNLGAGVNTANAERSPSLSADGLSLLFQSDRPGGVGGHDLYVATRLSTSEAFGNAVNLGMDVNTAGNEVAPTLSVDGLTLLFALNRPEGIGANDLYMATRSTVTDSFGNVVNLGPAVNTESAETNPSLSADGLSLYFNSNRPGGFGGHDIYVATRPNTSESFGDVVNVGPVINTADREAAPSIATDGRLLFFDSDRPNGAGRTDLYVGVRSEASAPFASVYLASNVNSTRTDRAASASFGGEALPFESDRLGGEGSSDLYQARFDIDWYQFTLDDGQQAALALTSLGPADVSLELYDSQSNLLASSQFDQTYLNVASNL